MTELEDLIQQKDTLQAKITEYSHRVKTETDATELGIMRRKMRIYREMIDDLKIQINYLSPNDDKPYSNYATRVAGARYVTLDSTCSYAKEFSSWELNGDGYAIKPIQQDEEPTEGYTWLCNTLSSGLWLLTQTQKVYINCYYNKGLSTSAIAEKFGVDKSTASRCIARAMRHLRDWVVAKRLAEDCTEAYTCHFDWRRFLNNAPKEVITDHQRDLLLRILDEKIKSPKELAERTGVDKSTCSRTLKRVRRYCVHLGIPNDKQCCFIGRSRSDSKYL